MPELDLIENNTLIFFDEIQDCVSTATSLKAFKEDGRYDVMMSNFKEQILLDYEEDITKYAGRLDKTKILNCYRKIAVFLGNKNRKFQISKISDGARNREYVGVVEWLSR